MLLLQYEHDLYIHAWNGSTLARFQYSIIFFFQIYLFDSLTLLYYLRFLIYLLSRHLSFTIYVFGLNDCLVFSIIIINTSSGQHLIPRWNAFIVV